MLVTCGLRISAQSTTGARRPRPRPGHKIPQVTLTSLAAAGMTPTEYAQRSKLKQADAETPAVAESQRLNRQTQAAAGWRDRARVAAPTLARAHRVWTPAFAGRHVGPAQPLGSVSAGAHFFFAPFAPFFLSFFFAIADPPLAPSRSTLC